MKIISIIRKSIKEQIRNFWILILTVSIAPFFVIIYNLIDEGFTQSYKAAIINNDTLTSVERTQGYHANNFINYVNYNEEKEEGPVLSFQLYTSLDKAKLKLKDKEIDLILVIPKNFSQSIENIKQSDTSKIDIEFIGDLTDYNYLMAAIWTHNYLYGFISYETGIDQPLNLIETGIGSSANLSSFDLYVPGLLIFSIIMLMFSATVAIIVESEKQTLKRIKLSRISSFEFLGGISIVQVIVGIVSVALTLAVAIALGFNVHGSFFLLLLISVLCSISIIAFSLIIAAFTKTVTDVLIVGNFPLFLFMFFSDVMFPINTTTLFKIGGYSLKANFMLSSTHAVSALKKVLIMQESFSSVLPEITMLLILTILYFFIGVWLFKRRHLKAE
ncbi:ABC transporter permease [Bacteroidota bacterium]